MSLPTTTRIDATVLRKVSDEANEIVRGLDAVNHTARGIARSMETDSPSLEEFFKLLDSRCE